MTIVPLIGHEDLRRRLVDAARQSSLPASLLLTGPRGVGKQRLALWIAQLLLCEDAPRAPCGHCRNCRFALELTHPDLHWYFPRPRLKDSDPDLDDVRDDYAEAIAERAKDGGLYAPPSGSEGIYIATVRAIVQQSVMSPAISERKVFIIGDAERMVSQEGSEQAANAFLKLLEEPSADTFIVLTSSEPGALLPTIRSRVVSIHVAPLPAREMQEFLDHKVVAERLEDDDTLPSDQEQRIAFAAGAPGRLLAGAEWGLALENAQHMLDAATGKPSARYEVAWAQASSKARGSFADTLDALTVALHARAKAAVRQGAARSAAADARAIDAVEAAKERIATNMSPQLITANLLRELQDLLA